MNSQSNPFDIKDKIILVTGGTRGLGRAIARHLVTHGARIIAGYNQNEKAAEEFREEMAKSGYPCDVIRANLMTSTGIAALSEHAAKNYGRLDVLIHNAATGVHKPLQELSQRHLMAIWQVNVGAFFDLALKLRPLMPNGSRVIALSSEGAGKAVLRYGAVGSSKAALEGLCRQMAAEWAADGISVNVVAPGLLETDTLSVWEDAANRVAAEIAASPIKRLVTLNEVALLVHFLCSRASDAIVGQVLSIDGGKGISSLRT